MDDSNLKMPLDRSEANKPQTTYDFAEDHENGVHESAPDYTSSE
jgi:hypothetical protein